MGRQINIFELFQKRFVNSTFDLRLSWHSHKEEYALEVLTGSSHLVMKCRLISQTPSLSISARQDQKVLQDVFWSFSWRSISASGRVSEAFFICVL